MLMTWLGYSLSLEGWCLWRDYDLTLGQLMSPTHPYSGAWPPALIPAGQTWPGGTSSSTTGGGTGTGAKAPSASQNLSAIERAQNILKYLPGFNGIP